MNRIVLRIGYRLQTALFHEYFRATSALDGLTEAELVAMFGRLRGRYATILISHRLSTLCCCDVILQLDRGTAVGGGSYEELMRSSERWGKTARAWDSHKMA
jgi:ABC-type transport system involved in Fe-S cluster assembly fused permease/ATPase subunit